MKNFAYVVRRLFAFGADWYLSSVLINLMTNAFSHFTLGEYSVHIALVIASLTVAILYYVLVPCKVWKGQTIMMRCMNLTIVDLDGKNISMLRIFLRFFVGCLIIEGTFYIPSVNVRSVLMIMYPNEIWKTISLIINISSAIGVTSILLNWKEFRLLHDLLFKSKVINRVKL